MFTWVKLNKITDNLIKWLGKSVTRISVAILSFIGFVTSIISFIQLFLGNRRTSMVALTIIGVLVWLAILGRLAYIGFSKKEKKIGRKHKNIHRFEDYLVAKQWLITLTTITAITVIGVAIFSYKKDQELRSKTLILLTNISGPNSENYLVNEKIYRQLNESLENYPEVLIQTTDEIVRENDQEGSNYARKLGARYRADMVLWGYYAATNSNALITIHVENMDSETPVPLGPSVSTEIQNTKEALDNFTIQQELSEQMTALVQFLSGVAYFQSENYDKALQLFNSALNSSDWADNLLNKAYIYDYRASYYISQYDYNNAMSDLETAIQLNPDNPKFYVHKGGYLAGLGRYNEALDSINYAIKLDKDFFQAYYERAYLYMDQGKYDDALSDINTMIQLDPNNPRPYFVRVWLNGERGSTSEAEDDLKKTFWLAPFEWTYYHSRARAYINLGESQKAIRNLNIVIIFNPSTTAYNDRAVAYMEIENYKKACRDLEAIKKKIERNDIAFLANLAECYNGLGETEKAIIEYTNIIEIFENPSKLDGISLWEKDFEAQAYNNRSVAYLNLKDYEAALIDANKAIELSPNMAAAYINRGSMYFVLNRKEDAKIDLEKAKTLTTKVQDLLYINELLAKLTGSP